MRRADLQVHDLKLIGEIITKCKTCRLAMVDGGKPYVVPLSFGFQLEKDVLTLFFHCATEGRKITVLRANSSVFFDISREGDPYTGKSPCNTGYYFESVMGSGKAEFVESPEEKSKALALLMEHQTGRKFEFDREQTREVFVFMVKSKDFTAKKRAQSPKITF